MINRERQKRLDKEYTIESNCIKREREKGKRNWAGGYFYYIIISV